MTNERLFQIDLGYACFAMASRDGVIVAVAPIMAWAIGRRLEQVRPWLLKKRAKVVEVEM